MPLTIPFLRGNHVFLQPLQREDAPVLKELARDGRIWEYTKRFDPDRNFDGEWDAYIDTALDPKALGGQCAFTVRQSGNRQIIGMTRFYEISESDKRLAIGYTWYSPEFWGGPHNKECKLLLLEYAFGEARFQRVEFHVAGQNIRSQKAVEKIGGVREGVLRKHGFRPDGSRKDTVIFSIIDEEWPGVKERLLQLLQEK